MVRDFKTGHVTIEGETRVLLDGEDAMICRRLVVQESIVIPARSPMDIATKTVYSNLKATPDAAGTSLMTESVKTAHELQIARTLVPNRLLEVPVRVMNVLDHPMTWEKGATVSSLEQVDVMTSTTEEARPAPDLTFKLDLLVAVDEEIQPAEKEALSQLLDEFEDVFSQGEYDLGSTDIVEHTIDTGDHKPIRQPLRRHPLPHQPAITEQTSEMLRQGLIEPAISEWTSNVILAKKMDGSMRICIDYRRLNEASRKDLYPLHRFDSYLDVMAGASCFSTFTSGPDTTR